MTEIVNGQVIKEDITMNAMGGTELMAYRLVKYIPQELLDDTQIIFSRVRELNPNCSKRILYCHDLPNDPEMEMMWSGDWRTQFNKIVFVSHWQKTGFLGRFKIPNEDCVVIPNAIEGFENIDKPTLCNSTMNVIYHTTPHRGLELILPIVEVCADLGLDIHFHIYSSFKIYGWETRDVHYQELYRRLKSFHNVTYYGTRSNQEVRNNLQFVSHVFLYPCIWPETSCLALIEAMMSKTLCIHTDLAALPETSMGLTKIIPYSHNKNIIASAAYDALIDAYRDFKGDGGRNEPAKYSYDLELVAKAADTRYNIKNVIPKWKSLLEGL